MIFIDFLFEMWTFGIVPVKQSQDISKFLPV